MTDHDRYLAHIHHQTDGVPMCKNCKHYYQHYTYFEDLKRFMPMNVGHCTEPRLKDRKPFDLCTRYEEKEEVAP